MPAIKNIIFDLGGVLLNIDFNKMKKAFEKLGIKNFDSFYTKDTANPIFESLETGHITNEDFYSSLQQHCEPGTSYPQIQQAWNEILINFRKESVEYLSVLKERYNIYLLSNTNSIHYAEFTEIFHHQVGGEAFDNRFTKAYYSHTLQKRKPYPETYRHVLNDAGIIASETLFIDDAVANIEGAKEAGLKVKLLGSAETIERLGL